MIAAVLPAAGIGSRFKQLPSDQSKQFILLGGKPVYIWSLSALAAEPQIARIALVTSPQAEPVDSRDSIDETLAAYLNQEQRSKILRVEGGATRQDSVRNGLEALAREADKPDLVLIHDAARPFLNSRMICDVIRSVTTNGACTLATRVTDTIKRTRGDIMTDTLDRDELVLLQTPQAARFDWMLSAHRRALADGFAATDDTSVLQRAGHDVHVVIGPRYNLKITSPEDFTICQCLAMLTEDGISGG